jgi:protein TonB
MPPGARSGNLSRHNALLAWCFAASIVVHALVAAMLPGWHAVKEAPPIPLSVELRVPPPPEIVPPKLLPVEPPPPVRAKPAPPKPEPVKPVQRAQRPVEPERAPILTAAPEVPAAPAVPAVPTVPTVPAVPVVPEPKPTPPPEPPRAPPAPVAAPPAPVTPPRSDAGYLNNPKPFYPLAAKRRGEEGTAFVKVMVTADGRAKDVALDRSSGSPALDEAALAAVRGWRFVPARQGTQAVEAPYVVPVVFKLE